MYKIPVQSGELYGSSDPLGQLTKRFTPAAFNAHLEQAKQAGRVFDQSAENFDLCAFDEREAGRGNILPANYPKFGGRREEGVQFRLAPAEAEAYLDLFFYNYRMTAETGYRFDARTKAVTHDRGFPVVDARELSTKSYVNYNEVEILSLSTVREARLNNQEAWLVYAFEIDKN